VLTEDDLLAIRTRHALVRSLAGDELVKGYRMLAASAADVPALLAEHERLCNYLAACWVLIDEVARLPGLASARTAFQARVLLSRQRVPGWTPPPALREDRACGT
jgi:hypothetical protein